jgi:hypothetical protein
MSELERILTHIYHARMRRGFARIGKGTSNSNAKKRMMLRLKNFLWAK